MKETNQKFNFNEFNELKIGCFGFYGKTAVIIRFLKRDYSEGNIPTIEDEFSRVISVGNRLIRLNVLDAASQDDFAEMSFSYYSQVQCFVLFFDISNPYTINDIRNMYNGILYSVGERPIIVLGGLNSDLREENNEDSIPKDEVLKLSNGFKCPVIEVSAKTGENVEYLFSTVTQNYLKSKTSMRKGKRKDYDIRGEWNIGLVGVGGANAKDLVRQYIFGEFKDDSLDEDYFKVVDVNGQIIPLNLHLF
ncbi:hypothetical protein M9Y10_014718 [Tritrichomonas musculus]|uniref:Ras family protein n=1 Tax=Tritrichomonas musculus TaxID=1915356 RepID=A0ABR2L0A7_9EUKA